MSQKILQINFTFSVSKVEYEEANLPYASFIADIPGVCWKIWLMSEAEGEAGGIYLFDDEAALQTFLAGPIVEEIQDDPMLSKVSLKQFDVMEEHTAITRGPVLVEVRV
jgi:hypothetical protein